jgi:hypothetical protein
MFSYDPPDLDARVESIDQDLHWGAKVSFAGPESSGSGCRVPTPCE